MGEEIIDFILFLAGAALLFGFGAGANRNTQWSQKNSHNPTPDHHNNDCDGQEYY